MSVRDWMVKVTSAHTFKLACVYVRQSTMGGVKRNIVGAERQRKECIKLALELGWPKERIKVVDDDQGRSGSTTEGRYGYMDLLNDIAEGMVGAVISLEPSRVGRDSADWHILIRICLHTDTLVIHPQGVYDASDYNDNTMMKFTAMVVEMEHRWITQRLQGAKRVLAEKGELRFFLPIGYVYGEDKKVILDPNEDVQRMVSLVFTLFKQLGSASKVASYFNEKGLKFPTLVRGGPRKNQYDWIHMTAERVVSMLRSPTYTGTYVYGRSMIKQRAVRKDGEVPRFVKYQEKLQPEDWKFVIHDAHPSYITWAEFQENGKRLKDNCTRPGGETSGAARGGPALLQGLVLCGKCGKRMRVCYPHSSFAHYTCIAQRVRFGAKSCQIVRGDWIDFAVEEAFLEALKPAQLEMSLQALERTEEQANEIDRQWALRLRRAEKIAAEANERLLATDHRNRRAYARVQEHYEIKTAELDHLKRERDEELKLSLERLPPEERETILALAQDFHLVWDAETTDMVMKKNLLRCLVEDVTIMRKGPDAQVGIRWKTQAHTTLNVKLLSYHYSQCLPARVIQFIRKMAPDHTDREIAAALNEAGIPNGRGKPFTKKRVKRIRERYELRKHPLDCSPDRRDDGRYSSSAIARMVGVPHGSVSRWCNEGRLDAVQDAHSKRWWINTTPEEIAEFGKTIRRRGNSRRNRANGDNQVCAVVLPAREEQVAPKGAAL